MFDDAFAYVLDNNRKLVASDMRMSIDKYGLVSSEPYKLMENFTDISSLGRAGVKLSVREGTCAALTEAIVRTGSAEETSLYSSRTYSDMTSSGL